MLRNSLIPVVTLCGLDFGAVSAAARSSPRPCSTSRAWVCTRPTRSTSLDLPPLIAVTMFGAFFIVLLNTIVDIGYAFLDPRIRLG